MEKTRLALIALIFLLFHHKRSFGEEVEMKVRPGENITLFCDRSLSLGSVIVWIRNCSHENQPSLIMDFRIIDLEKFQRLNFIHNPYDNSHGLHITNISVSDLGLYYCAEVEKKVNRDQKGIISSSKAYYYGNRTTRLSLEGPLNSTSTAPPVSDCVLCRTLLFSVCPVCVLLSFICVLCLCCKNTTGSAADQKDNHKNRTFFQENDVSEVCYASVDVVTWRQNRKRETQEPSSDFTTYAHVRTETE
ncbi:uncharacterized protein LOC122351065 [Puntigrus tetrazona]|uniref:uncharacterized protein LOC122351065 n=1 Tax=Puntigrus tetrazona TaxID=1606681 RepID=UPI001C898B7C|nr:uncharacterized protein LOC122351065 [Puntigrus tetrazona]